MFSLFPVYRPEPNVLGMNAFFNEFSSLLEDVSLIAHDIIILGDFNIHIDVAEDTSNKRFMGNITAFNLVQHVSESTHEWSHP